MEKGTSTSGFLTKLDFRKAFLENSQMPALANSCLKKHLELFEDKK
jgi:hypothetical protein